MPYDFKQTINSFWVGFTGAGGYMGYQLLQVDNVTGSGFGIKLLVAITIAFAGGFASVGGKEFALWIKSKINKNKDNGSN